jgi:selenide,water dikinase
LRDHGATSCTDVTGFGLLGHLVEMAQASKARVELNLDKVPTITGALELVQQGIFSPPTSALPGCVCHWRCPG